jgi:hypothetical protein
MNRRGTTLLAGFQEFLEFLLQTAHNLDGLVGAIGQNPPDVIEDMLAV